MSLLSVLIGVWVLDYWWKYSLGDLKVIKKYFILKWVVIFKSCIIKDVIILVNVAVINY